MQSDTNQNEQHPEQALHVSKFLAYAVLVQPSEEQTQPQADSQPE